MTTTEAPTTQPPIATRSIKGAPCVIGPADAIRPAITDGQTITITTGPLTGDVVRLAARECDRDGYWGMHSIADTHDHPEHGLILTAWIDTTITALDEAPKLRAILARRRTEVHGMYARAAAAVPTCDNCGDCPRCV